MGIRQPPCHGTATVREPPRRPARYSTPMSDLLGYFITFRTYGTWLHGDMRGSTDYCHNTYGTPRLAPDPRLVESTRKRMHGPPYVMGVRERAIVHAAIEETCRFRDWHIWALKVRTNHVHIVLSAPGSTAERVMNDLKIYATRALRRASLIQTQTQVWSRHGSTPHLFESDQLAAAIQYVTLLQDSHN